MMARPLVGRTIRRLRSERRLTQQTLATQLGISVERKMSLPTPSPWELQRF